MEWPLCTGLDEMKQRLRGLRERQESWRKSLKELRQSCPAAGQRTSKPCRPRCWASLLRGSWVRCCGRCGEGIWRRRSRSWAPCRAPGAGTQRPAGHSGWSATRPWSAWRRTPRACGSWQKGYRCLLALLHLLGGHLAGARWGGAGDAVGLCGRSAGRARSIF